MTSVLLHACDAPDAADLETALREAGIHVLGATERRNLVRDVARHAPDVLVWAEAVPQPASFEAVALLQQTVPVPVLMFCRDQEAERIEQAVASGVHAYVVEGYAPSRLRPLLQLARARFAAERKLREALGDITHRFEERKLVDRAKGILMRATQISEDEAFRLLRTASMRDNQRVGQVSRQLIDAAHGAEAVNRAGQLRMLSQRAVKLHALTGAQADARGCSALLAQTVERIDANLAWLRRHVSAASFGDLVDTSDAAWSALRAGLAAPQAGLQWGQLDEQAEQLLLSAERLTASLEAASRAGGVHVINLCGRQRMLSQRFAKQAVLAGLLPEASAEAMRRLAQEGVAEFEAGLACLARMPLSDAGIRDALQAAERSWRELRQAAQQAGTAAGRLALAAGSEALLAQFEALTERYERSMNLLIG